MKPTWQTRLEVEKFIYSKGTNVALYHAEHSETYKVFQSRVEDLLNSQVKDIANHETHLPLLMSLARAASAPLDSQLTVLIKKFQLGIKLNLEDFLIWAGTQGGQAFLDKMHIHGVFGLVNPKLIQYFNDYTKLRISTVDDYTKKWIAEKIQEGKDTGLTPFQISKSLIDEGKKINALRAERIVLSETARAMRTIEREAAHRVGIHQFIWRTSRDERVCPVCFPLDGVQSDAQGRYPDVGDGPPAHVNCRCWEDEVIPEGWEAPAHPWMGE